MSLYLAPKLVLMCDRCAWQYKLCRNTTPYAPYSQLLRRIL